MKENEYSLIEASKARFRHIKKDTNNCDTICGKKFRGFTFLVGFLKVEKQQIVLDTTIQDKYALGWYCKKCLEIFNKRYNK